jgi:hypothetical protein
MKRILILLIAAALLLAPVSALAKTASYPSGFASFYAPYGPAPTCGPYGSYQTVPKASSSPAVCPTASPSAKPAATPSEPVPTYVPAPAKTPEATLTPIIPRTGSELSLSSLLLLPLGALFLIRRPGKKQS